VVSTQKDPVPDDVAAFAGQLFDLARDGDVEQLVGYLDAGVAVDLTNGKGDSLLMLAAYHDHLDAVRVLLARGADHARINDRGQTALAAAVFRRSREGVQLLLDAGADPDLGGPSAVELARFFDLDDVLEWLQPR
jgi:ankyrin repeat protein